MFERGTREWEVTYFIAMICFVVGIIAVMTIRFPPTIPRVRDILERGPTILVLRFPESPTEQREQIIIREYEETRILRSFVTVGGEAEQGIVNDLPPEQRALWTQLRAAYCQETPADPDPSLPAFEIALRCPKPDGSSGRPIVFRITASQLPQELRTLIATVPSPSCKDPLCGW